MKRKSHRIRNFFILFTLGIFIALGYYVFEETDLFIIQDINVIGNLRVPNYEIEHYLSDEPIHYFKDNPYDLEESLVKHPLLKKVEIEKVFPNILEVKVLERKPVAALFYSEQYLLIDEELVVVDVTKENDEFYVVTGYQFTNFHVGVAIHDKNSYLLKNIVELIFLIHYTNYDVLPTIEMRSNEIYLVFDENFEAKFGDGNNMELRYNNMIDLYFSLIGDDNARGTIRVNNDGEATLMPFGE